MKVDMKLFRGWWGLMGGRQGKGRAGQGWCDILNIHYALA